MFDRLAQFLGPIFVREIIEIARRKRYYMSRTIYGIALLIVMTVVWEENLWMSRGIVSINAMARFAAELFEAISVLQYVAAYLFVPMFLCPIVCSEREEHTLDLLLTTQLSDREIVLGKLASRMAAMACLILCGLPVMSLILLYGGVAPEALWRVLTTTLLAILFVGAHAVYFSVTTKSPLEALVRTYWWLGIGLLAAPGLCMFLIEEIRPLRRALGLWPMVALTCANPVAQFGITIDGYTFNRLRAFAGPWFFAGTFVLPLLWATLLLWRAVRRLRQSPVGVLLWVKGVPVIRTLWRWWQRPDKAARRRARAERWWPGRTVTNPLWLRSRLAHVYDRSGHIGLLQAMAWVVTLGILLLVAIFDTREIHDEECSQAFQGLVWIAIAGLAGLIAATSLIGDRRRGFLDLVLVTPLSGQQIIDGTFLAVWEHVRRLFWLPWFLAVLFGLTGASPPHGTLCSLVTATLFCVLFVWHAVGCSLAARTVPGALIASFLFPVAAMGATGLLIGFFGRHHGPAFWILGSIILPPCVLWICLRRNLASLASASIAVHIFLAGLATCWTYDGRNEEYPIGAMQPGFYVVALLDDRPGRWFGHQAPPWFAMLICYWLAVVVNIVLLRRWLIRHFDDLADRAGQEMEPQINKPR